MKWVRPNRNSPSINDFPFNSALFGGFPLAKVIQLRYCVGHSSFGDQVSFTSVHPQRPSYTEVSENRATPSSHPIFDGLYHPFTVNLGIVKNYCFNHIIHRILHEINQPAIGDPPWLYGTHIQKKPVKTQTPNPAQNRRGVDLLSSRPCAVLDSAPVGGSVRLGSAPGLDRRCWAKAPGSPKSLGYSA